uniref:Aminotransferase class V n=1 Tax=Acetithermum autotrophicum TaxID=1446466 RepID=H5SU13_ACEAU|nr:aminotransferase class V [Candidatus Acetothermum autotrophicum]
MAKRDFLLTPGPVNVPRRVALAESQEIIYHRGEEFAELLQRVDAKLKRVFRTQNTILYFTSSGTGAMEAAVTNLLSTQDEVIVVEGGKFGQRWRELCHAFGVKHHVIQIEWGRAVRPQQVAQALDAHPNASAVLTQLSETSTGTVYDIEQIARITNERDVLLVVDAISGLGAVPLEPDRWGVDCVVAGSQKSLMVPPGLAFVSVSERAWERAEKSDLPKYYWDFKAARKNLYFTPFTPAISLVMALDEALDIILEEGLENLLARTELYAQATRAAIHAMNLQLFSERPGPVCTAVRVPQGTEWERDFRDAPQGFSDQDLGRPRPPEGEDLAHWAHRRHRGQRRVGHHWGLGADATQAGTPVRAWGGGACGPRGLQESPTVSLWSVRHFARAQSGNLPLHS